MSRPRDVSELGARVESVPGWFKRAYGLSRSANFSLSGQTEIKVKVTDNAAMQDLTRESVKGCVSVWTNCFSIVYAGADMDGLRGSSHQGAFRVERVVLVLPKPLVVTLHVYPLRDGSNRVKLVYDKSANDQYSIDPRSYKLRFR